ncbi:PKD domain-containing protein [Nocardia sp. JMUB6875]|uniref:PKD domain-containing protein n=1 Tax=Nocardia sp. JMUB6875 TaxID=3158170 RepID=UPI0034E8CBC2
MIAGLNAPPTSADIITDYPQIVDVSIAPDSACSGPVHGTAAVFLPLGAALHSEVEWRIRSGENVFQTGVVAMRDTVASVQFELPADEPANGAVQVDARVRLPGGIVGNFGKPWEQRVNRDCRPLHVVSIGDSVVWGQGLEHDQKFSHLTAAQLGAQTGRGFQLHDYSISGAVIDGQELPEDDATCLSQRYPQDTNGDGTMEFGEVTDQMPDVFCQLAKAKANAAADGYPVDLVIMNGGINDLDPFFGIPLGITPGSQDLASAVRREIGGEGAAAVNPAKDVPYFSGAKRGYGGRGMRAAIEKAHSLPGHPKVLVADYYYAIDAQGMPDQAQRWAQFVGLSSEAYRQAASQANANSPDGPYAVAADGLFTQDNGILGPDPKMWVNPVGDNEISLRAAACPMLSPLPPQCLSAAMGHPNVAGARQYADNFLLNPQLRAWFGLGAQPSGPGFTMSDTSGNRGLTVGFDASQLPTGDIRQYNWYFGDGSSLTTTEPIAQHTYSNSGPNLARLVVTDAQGNRTMFEADRPIDID